MGLGWFLLIALFAVLVMVQITHSVISQAEAVPAWLMQKAIDATPLVKVTRTEHYYGTDPLVLLYGPDRGGEEMVVFMTEEGKVLHYDWPKKAYPPVKIDQWVRERYPGSMRLHLVPGIEHGIPLWEGLYKTKEGKYLYVYFRLHDGTFLRSIALTP